MKKISVYIFSLGLIMLLSAQAYPQSPDTAKVYGLRLGLDIARIGWYFNTPSETGAELSADFEVYPNVFAIFEGGFNSVSFEKENYTYSLRGNFYRIGVDYNFLKTDEKPNNHMIYAGLRYGFSPYIQHFDNAIIPSELWGDFITSEEYRQIAHWIGLTGGIKVQVLKNFYLGWNIQYNFIITSFKDEPDPFLIPGFGHLKENRPVTVHYSLLYTIPFFKK